MKLFALFLIVFLLLQVFAEALPTSDDQDSSELMDDAGIEASLRKGYHLHKKINCSYACARRCRKSSRKNVCHRACKTCCARCHCVPPGTYGNKSVCPCYAKLKTHRHQPKCP
ncbi:gibberellin-regulated protein 9-like [Apium graveolens]|uniref:gibberellin-regulated protein 9-like n=1 Tax=Apium graveolens TaxID=4045 RepID=UPI003D7B34F3